MHMRESLTRRLRGEGFPPGAEAQGSMNVFPVVAVVASPTFIPSRLRGHARTAFKELNVSREAARTRGGQWRQLGQI